MFDATAVTILEVLIVVTIVFIVLGIPLLDTIFRKN